jgi:hypothetical protein
MSKSTSKTDALYVLSLTGLKGRVVKETASTILYGVPGETESAIWIAKSKLAKPYNPKTPNQVILRDGHSLYYVSKYGMSRKAYTAPKKALEAPTAPAGEIKA